MPKKFYSVKEASKIIGVSTNTIYKYLDDGSLKGKRMGGRGRFKIPYSEVAPYSVKVAQPDAVDNVDTLVSGASVTDSAEENKPSFFGPLLGTVSIGLGALFTLWVIGSVAMGAEPAFMKDVGGAAVNYSGRTFSGFGNLVSHLSPAKKTENPEVAGAKVSELPKDVVSEEKSPDLNDKLKDTERLAYELYVNTQTLAASTQKLLGKSRTLTTSELNDAVVGMSELLGSTSDSPDKNTIAAQINLLADNWNFPALESVNRSTNQVGSILDSLESGSLGAFTKLDIKDVDELVSQAELLQRLVGEITDTSADKTVFGNLREAGTLAKALDTKNAEIDKILGDWGGYDITEKENTVNIILSDTLSINTLPRMDEMVTASPSAQLGDTGLKNILLVASGILDANKIHLSQKAAEPVRVTWNESDGAVYKALIVNPSVKSSQEVAYKYYLPVGFKRGDVKDGASGLTLNFDSQKNRYFMEANVQLPAGGVKTLSLQVGDIKPVADTINTPKAAEVEEVSQAPEVIANINQSEVLGINVESPSPVKPLVKPEVTAVPVIKATPLPKVAAVAAVPVPVKTATPNPTPSIGVVAGIGVITPDVQRIIGLAISFLAIGILAVYLLRLGIFGFLVKAISFVVKSILKMLVSIFKFFINILLSIKKFLVAVVMFPVKVARAAVFAVAAFFRKILSLIKSLVSSGIKTLVSVKTFIFSIPGAILTFILKVISLTKKFFISLLDGFYKLVTSIIAFIKQVATGIVQAIRKFVSGVISAVNAFFVRIFSAVTKAALFVKTGILTIISGVKTFFLKIISLVSNLIISIIAALFRTVKATVGALTRFVKGVVSLVVNTAVIIKIGAIKTLTKVKDFFLDVISTAIKFIVAVAISLKKGIQTAVSVIARFVVSTILAVKTFIVRTVNSIITFIEKIVLAVAKAIAFVVTGIIGILASIATFFLKAVSMTAKALARVVGGLLKILVAITDGTDSTLTKIHIEAPRFRGSRIHYHKAAVLILVATLSAVISSVFAFTVMAQIEKSPVAPVRVTEEPSLGSPKKEKVIIKETGTGWLRVRSTPGGSEIGRVNPGEEFYLLDKKDGWVLIELSDGQKGWVSSKYASFE